ncbi:MAG: iron-sulfur cluster assembly scaffold protein, partial [Lactococcus lactis]|jgi:nitrogen fixation NifU-like protein
MVTGETDERQEKLGDAQFLAGVSKFPARVKCSTLAWNALKKAIDVGEAQETVIHGE